MDQKVIMGILEELEEDPSREMGANVSLVFALAACGCPLNITSDGQVDVKAIKAFQGILAGKEQIVRLYNDLISPVLVSAAISRPQVLPALFPFLASLCGDREGLVSPDINWAIYDEWQARQAKKRAERPARRGK